MKSTTNRLMIFFLVSFFTCTQVVMASSTISRPSKNRPTEPAPKAVHSELSELLRNLQGLAAHPASGNPRECREFLRIARTPEIPLWNVSDRSILNNEFLGISIGDSPRQVFVASEDRFQYSGQLYIRPDDVKLMCNQRHYTEVTHAEGDEKQFVITRELDCPRPDDVVNSSSMTLKLKGDEVEVIILQQDEKTGQVVTCVFTSTLQHDDPKGEPEVVNVGSRVLPGRTNIR
jgi:hypothetical protein